VWLFLSVLIVALLLKKVQFHLRLDVLKGITDGSEFALKGVLFQNLIIQLINASIVVLLFTVNIVLFLIRAFPGGLMFG